MVAAVKVTLERDVLTYCNPGDWRYSLRQRKISALHLSFSSFLRLTPPTAN